MSEDKGLLDHAMVLAAHVLWGTCIFGIIAWAAYVLQKCVEFLAAAGMHNGFIMMLEYVEILIFYLDIFSFVVMMVGAACIFARKVVREVRSS